MLEKHSQQKIRLSTLHSISTIHGGQVIFALVLAFLLFVGSLNFQVPISYAAGLIPAYSCSSNNCYGIATWLGPTEGTRTSMTMGDIFCGSCDGFVINDMWLTDSYESSCIDPSGGNSHNCWVEAGYTTYGTTDHHHSKPCVTPPANCYYWADNRPGGGYHEHPIANVQSSDYGQGLFLQTYETSYGGGTFYVELATPSGTYYEYSYNNSMKPDTITIGQELFGTTGAGSNESDYRDSEWEDLNTGVWRYQTGSGQKISQDPPYGSWSIPPNCCNYGGDFRIGAW